jgi:SMI1-KNR4 cell-wall
MVFFKGIEFKIEGEVQAISEEEIILAESELNVRFPDDYRDFIMKFGEGEVDGFWIRWISPTRIVQQELPFVREIMGEFWSWNTCRDGFDKEKAMSSIPLFVSSGGEIILFDPCNNNNWYILPHDEEEISLVHGFEGLFDFYIQMYNCPDALIDNPPILPPFKFTPSQYDRRY